MANKKYDDKDLENWCKGITTINELMTKYNVSKGEIVRSANRHGYYSRKIKVKIVSPAKTMVCDSISECAYELGVSIPTIKKALRGERVKIFDELDIFIKEVKK